METRILLLFATIHLVYSSDQKDYEALVDHLTLRLSKNLGLLPKRYSITPDIPEKFDNVPRQKRKTVPEACLIDCATSMTVKVRNMAANAEDFRFVNSELLEEGQLEQFCGLYMMGKKCIDGCPDSQSKNNLLITFRPLNYICVEHHKELLTHLTCYRESQIAIDIQCSARCVKSNPFIKDLRYYQEMGRTLEEIVTALDELCSRLECELECQEPIIKSICRNDTSAAEYMRNFARESILPMEAIMKKTETLRFWPSNCHRITQGLGVKSKQKYSPPTSSPIEDFQEPMIMEYNLEMPRNEPLEQKPSEKTTPKPPNESVPFRAQSGHHFNPPCLLLGAAFLLLN